MMKIVSKRLLTLGMAGSLVFGAAVTTGCFGTFPFARTIWEINKDISSNKFVQWLVFLGLTILPVYEAAVIIDLFVGNSLEFWSGESIVVEDGEHEQPPKEKVVELSDGRTAHMTRLDNKHVHVKIFEDGEVDREYVLDGRGDSLELRDGEGHLLGAASSAGDGGVLVTDEEGRVIEHHDARSVDQLQDDIKRAGADGANEFAADYRREREPLSPTDSFNPTRVRAAR
jgi:hypothetical protein